MTLLPKSRLLQILQHEPAGQLHSNAARQVAKAHEAKENVAENDHEEEHGRDGPDRHRVLRADAGNFRDLL